MPSSRVHLLAGGAVFAGVYTIMHKTGFAAPFSPPLLAFFCGLTLLGSIFPDIDVASNMQKTFYRSLFFVLPLTFFLQKRLFCALVVIAGMLPLVKHRGVTHKPWFLILVPAAVCSLIALQQPGHQHELTAACIFLSTGALSHVALDRLKTAFLYRKR